MNSQPEDKFEQRIRERLQSWEATPAENAWSRLVSDLPTRVAIWHRMLILGVLISMIGGVMLVWKWTTLKEVDERTVQENTSPSPLKPDGRGSHPLPSATLPFPEVSASSATSSRAFADTTGQKQAPLPDAGYGNYRGSQPRTHGNRIVRLDSSSRAPVDDPLAESTQSTAYDRGRTPVDEKTHGSHPFASPVTDQRDTRSDLNGPMTHSIPFVATISRNLVRIETRLPTIVAKVSSIKLSPQPQNLPNSASQSRWELWATTNPMLLYQRVTPNPSDAINVTSLNQRSFSKDRLGVQLSTGVRYRLSPRLALELGAYYRLTRNRWTYNYHETLTDRFQVVAIDEKTIQARPLYQEQVGSIRETNHHVGALVGVRYRLSSRWLSNTIGTELQAHYDHDQTAWFTQLSYLAEKTLSDHWSVSGGPTFLWNVSGNRQQYEYFTLKPYGFGAQLGINYRLSFGKRR